jgi:hypothetical protein
MLHFLSPGSRSNAARHFLCRAPAFSIDRGAAHAASGSCWKERRKRNKASPLNERADILAASSSRLFNSSSTPTLSCSRFSSAFRLAMSSLLISALHESAKYR